MSLRGVGIIDVMNLYGAGAVRSCTACRGRMTKNFVDRLGNE